MKPAKSNDKKLIDEELVIDCNKDRWYGNEDNDNEQYFHISTNKYSLSFRDWSELLNLRISKVTDEHYTDAVIIANFIWEITWHGDEKESKRMGKSLLSSLPEKIK